MTHLKAAAFAVIAAAPAGASSVIEVARAYARLGTLVTAIEAADLADMLAGPGPFTLYAPTDDAFADLPAGSVEALLDPANGDSLNRIVLYHVDDRALRSTDLPGGTIRVRTMLESARLCVTNDRDGVRLADSTQQEARVVEADVQADNGVIHVIDKVLVPGGLLDCESREWVIRPQARGAP
ncbi:fasciclin domain-containing protein [Jannaschia aquimarina]|uniref:Immunogenic protein MPT70 n=1 Tax=Jannaschia aquimarina TaxID=935700 RepID=A0A0D1EKP7_9RHOB|nr:fasciclin domain-containing protein [Jannaschia aquimarina]KIT18164.1 Immunogenic protein MPT70 precursor [Jannaschia aquimarina]SNT30750.1 Uncaracterized surface protein containing fasciclin (FAS1) repeats [Jannaschia aquimarina]